MIIVGQALRLPQRTSRACQNRRSARPVALVTTFALGLTFSLSAPAAEQQQTFPIPDKPTTFLENYCLGCHDEDTEKGEVNLDFLEIAWSQRDVQDHWERALDALKEGVMPPEDKRQPSKKERAAMIAWIEGELLSHSQPGGTVARRLNQQEYLNTVRQLFGVPFTLPEGFPPDIAGHHGFENIGESLILSAPLMEAYSEAAAAVADEIFPPLEPPVESATFEVLPDDMVISYSSSSIRDGAMRLVGKSAPVSRSCTWPSKFEVKASGVYRVVVKASAFRPPEGESLILEVRAKSVDSTDNETVPNLRRVHHVELSAAEPRDIEFEAELYRNETLLFYFANGPLDSDNNPEDKAAFADLLRAKFADDPRLLAAWQQVKHDNGLRGGIGWERVKALMARDDLDLSEAKLDHPNTEKLLKKMTGNPVLYVETVSYQHFEEGPGIDIHRATIEGPLRLVEDADEKRRQRVRGELLGERDGRDDEAWGRDILQRLLTRVYRRPVPADDPAIDAWWQLTASHMAEGNDFEAGIHLALRTALISPRFLYRSLGESGELLDEYELAARLAYFLTNSPPDVELLRMAEQGRLKNSFQLRKQAERLLASKANAGFVESFTGQWLDTRELADIMPDSRLKFSSVDKTSASKEVEMFFAAMLKENRPMTDFIDPDFTYTTDAVGKKIYGITKGLKKGRGAMQRVSLPRGGRHGGILGQAGVMMATANGVDTEIVRRGVWVLENVLGDPPPPPPESVPALTPDTTSATSPRELLAQHASEESCAGCHRKIDPLGFALENFDPVGRWRDHYPIFTVDENGQPVDKQGAAIDSTGQLPDGTPIRDIVDLKRWLVEHIDQFSGCVSEKLLTYATGRSLNYAERKDIEKIVERHHRTADAGFRDLTLDLIDSETFRRR